MSSSGGPADMYSDLVSAVEDSEVFALKIAVCSGSEEKEGGGGTRRKKQR